MQHQVHGSNLYSIARGKVIGKGFQANGFGNYIILKDNNSLNGFLYGHMSSASPLNIGDIVDFGTYVGHEGQTGHATGIHLHLEMQYLGTSETWQFGLPISDLENPANYLGIPNQYGISVIYYGEIPPTPSIRKKKKFPWVIYANKIRKRNLTN